MITSVLDAVIAVKTGREFSGLALLPFLTSLFTLSSSLGLILLM
ncbi:unnamed protein product [Gordionus sp. m RMFG-2023]